MSVIYHVGKSVYTVIDSYTKYWYYNLQNKNNISADNVISI